MPDQETSQMLMQMLGKLRLYLTVEVFYLTFQETDKHKRGKIGMDEANLCGFLCHLLPPLLSECCHHPPSDVL